jgi:hypothetical protein
MSVPDRGEDDWIWLIATISRAADRNWEIRGTQTLSNEAAEVLQAKGRLINEVAKQREFNRLVEAVRRWAETLTGVERQLRDQGTLSAGLRVAVALDFIAMARAVELCEEALVETSQRAAAVDAQYAEGVRRLEEMRHSLRARPAYLVVPGLAARARTGDLNLVLVDGIVRFAGITSHGAAELSHVLMLELARLVFLYLDVFSQALEEAASELVALTASLPPGAYPDLIRFPSNAAESLPDARFANLPIAEAIALKQFRTQVPTLTTPSRLAEAVFELMGSGTHHRFQVGDIDISGAAVTGTASDTVNAPATAKIDVDLDLIGSAPVDYWARVTIDAALGNYARRLFSGAVQQARVGSQVCLECEGAVELTEHNLAGMVAANVDEGELVRSLMRQAGLPDDTVVLTAAETPQPEEVFEVVVPIRGLTVDEPVRIGPMAIVPTGTYEAILAAFDFTQEPGARLEEAFRDATAYGLAHARARALDSAEELGYGQIQTAMAWLIVRERNGFCRLPDGTAQPFSRQDALRAPEAGRVILVHGAETGRQWLRWPLGSGEPLTRRVDDNSRFLNPPLPDHLHPSERRSLLALKRAVAEVSSEPQLQALWEALESYAAGVKGAKLFSKEQRRELEDAIPTWMTPEQQDKFTKAIADLNRPPLGVRLGWRLERDAVPLAARERELLFEKLRNARNDVAHGRAIANPPRREDMLLGISVVARIILFGIAARAEA